MAFCVAEVDRERPTWTATCSRLGRQDSGRHLPQLRMEFEEETSLRSSSCSWAHATVTWRFRPVWVDTDYWIAFFITDDTGDNRWQTLIPTAFCYSCELLAATLYKTNEIYLPTQLLFCSHAAIVPPSVWVNPNSWSSKEKTIPPLISRSWLKVMVSQLQIYSSYAFQSTCG